MAADIGDLARLGCPSQDTDTAPFTTILGVATNPTSVYLDVLKPDGSFLSYAWPVAGADGSLTNESAGRFYADVLLTLPGTWRWRLAGVGAVTAASESSLRVDRQRVVVP